MDYDYLIYAIGSHGATPIVPGAAEFAYPISELSKRSGCRRHFKRRTDAPIRLIGAGPTGLEVASEFAEEGRPSLWSAAAFSGRTSAIVVAARRPGG